MINISLTINILIYKFTLYFPILNKTYQINFQNLINSTNQLQVNNEECFHSIFKKIFLVF